MESTTSSMEIEIIPQRHIIFSAGKGKATLSDLKSFIETVIEKAAPWKETGWGYIADSRNMDPAAPEIINELVTLHKKFVENGCRAFAFIDNTSAVLRAQAKLNQKRSSTDVEEGHFSSLEEALDWLQQLSL